MVTSTILQCLRQVKVVQRHNRRNSPPLQLVYQLVVIRHRFVVYYVINVTGRRYSGPRKRELVALDPNAGC